MCIITYYYIEFFELKQSQTTVRYHYESIFISLLVKIKIQSLYILNISKNNVIYRLFTIIENKLI